MFQVFCKALQSGGSVHVGPASLGRALSGLQQGLIYSIWQHIPSVWIN